MLVLTRIRALLVRCWESAKNLSFFYQYSTDPQKIESGRIATRIYVVLLINFLGTFIGYYRLSDVSRTISVKKPSINTYYSLFDRYPSVTCPCQSIDIAYSQFIQVTPVYHQVESELHMTRTRVLSNTQNYTSDQCYSRHDL